MLLFVVEAFEKQFMKICFDGFLSFLSFDAAMPMNQKLSIPTLQMQCKVITFSAFLYSSSDI